MHSPGNKNRLSLLGVYNLLELLVCDSSLLMQPAPVQAVTFLCVPIVAGERLKLQLETEKPGDF